LLESLCEELDKKVIRIDEEAEPPPDEGPFDAPMGGDPGAREVASRMGGNRSP
jgi:hypothetical protein